MFLNALLVPRRRPRWYQLRVDVLVWDSGQGPLCGFSLVTPTRVQTWGGGHRAAPSGLATGQAISTGLPGDLLASTVLGCLPATPLPRLLVAATQLWAAARGVQCPG